MGTSLRIWVEAGDRTAAIRAAEAAIRAVETTDDLLSTWRPDTELARFNQTPAGLAVPLSPALRAILDEARTLTAATGGAFDPTVGALVDAWDLRGAGALPDADRLRVARDATGWDRFRIGPTTATRRHPGAWLDTGAFGKGLALRAARAALETQGIRRALLNFGGQVMVIGPADAPAWRIPVADPRARTATLCTIELRAGSAATSGQSERTLVIEGRPVGHLLDPRTGTPVPPWGSVTVVDPDPLRADALATALFVLGPDEGWAWAERHHVAALVVTRNASGPVRRPTSALRTPCVAPPNERAVQ